MVDHVVFIPGICGSELYDGEKLIWPGTAWEKLVSGYPKEDVELLANSKTLRVGSILDKVTLFGADIVHFATGYNKAIELLDSIGFKLESKNFTPYPYDWRHDIKDTAKKFHDRLMAPDLAGKTIGIVAHSMGGLIARYALEVIGKLENVVILILAAVPHLGATVTYLNLIGARSEIFLTGEQCQRVVNNPDFPAAYQLLPHPSTKSFFAPWSGGLKPADIYDEEVYLASNLIKESMEKAENTWKTLPLLQLGNPTPCQYFAVAGNSGKTVVAVYLPGKDAKYNQVETSAGGDSTVPIWSAAPPSIPSRFVPCDHLGVFEDGQMQKVLQGLLTSQRPNEPPFMVSQLMENTQSVSMLQDPEATDAMPNERLSVQVSTRSIEANSAKHVVASLVLLDNAQAIIQGNLLVSSVTEKGKITRPPIPISYAGAPVDKIDIWVAIEQPGLLVIDFESVLFPGDPNRQATVLVLPPSANAADPAQ